MMQSKKTILYIFAALGLAVLLIWFGSAAYSAWQGYTFQKKTDAFQMALSKPYREDTYGGKTPEETWAMFLDALRKDDLELASKYIVPEKRAEWKKILDQTIKEKGSIEISKLENIKIDSKTDTTAYYYRLVSENGKQINSSVNFILNPYTKVWKISLL